MSDSSTSGTSFVLILMALGGFVWLVQHGLTDSPKPEPVSPVKDEEPVSST